MDKHSNNSHLQLTELPVEILRIILSHSGDVISLDSTVHSCSTLFHAFYGFPAPIITAVIQREIGNGLLFEAVRFARASDLKWSQHGVVVANAAFADFLRRDQETPHQFRWTLQAACFVTRLHRIVKSLSLRIESDILERIQSIHPHVEMKPASSTELPRIQRALYRFETYRILFPVRQYFDSFPVRQVFGFDYSDEESDDESDNIIDPDDGMKAQMLFLAASPPWENEQLGCVHESLWRLVAPGLKEINEISLCNTWAERYDLLGYDRPHRSVREFRSFLRKTFEYYEGYCFIEYSQTTGTHRDTHYPVGRDTTEEGPQKTWDWLTQRWSEQPNFEARKRIVVVMETARLRACGYVFWDEERMVDLGWMNSTSMDWHSDVLDFVNNPPILHDSDEVDLSEVLHALSAKGLRGHWNGGVGHVNLMWAERDAWLRPWMKSEETSTMVVGSTVDLRKCGSHRERPMFTCNGSQYMNTEIDVGLDEAQENIYYL